MACCMYPKKTKMTPDNSVGNIAVFSFCPTSLLLLREVQGKPIRFLTTLVSLMISENVVDFASFAVSVYFRS